MRRMYDEKEIKKLAAEEVKKSKIDWNQIVDSSNNSRFQDGEITIETIEGVSSPFAKWSLSGSHLLIVVCLDLASDLTLTDNTLLAKIVLPKWIVDSIVPIVSTILEYISTTAYASDYTTQTFTARLAKSGTTELRIVKEGNLTLTKERLVRIAFDLLI